MLIDKLRINLKAGRGGNGHIHFNEVGMPSGGNGGDGGNIYFQGSFNLHDLSKLKYERDYKAEVGDRGSDNNKTGKGGTDLVIQVPLKTIVTDLEGNQIAEISKHDEKVLLAKGGRGGLGNYFFRRGQVATLRKTTPGKPGQELMLMLDLELQSDVVFIGLPNAGKSSMLNALTNATVKVAPYPFTTLHPNLANAGGLILMDLPGLIEGTSAGKGLGSNFMKHARSARLVVHFISLENSEPFQDYQLIREELVKINPALCDLPEVIILNKKDILAEEAAIKIQKQLAKQTGKPVLLTSSFDYDSVKELFKFIKKLIVKS
ncbi:MAG: Obg family GTPase CgtA [bacterium]